MQHPIDAPRALKESRNAPRGQFGPITRSLRCAVAIVQNFVFVRLMRSEVQGTEHVPLQGGFFVCSNHVSHLDAGLIKLALGQRGAGMLALAAADYFFANPVSRWFFTRLTNVMPIARNRGFRQALMLGVKLVKEGAPLLIFPEGTRSTTGVMAPFKPALAFMALSAQRPIVPIHVEGTFVAMPKGRLSWPFGRKIVARVGPPIGIDVLEALSCGVSRHEAHHQITECLTRAVVALKEGRQVLPMALAGEIVAGRSNSPQAKHEPRRDSEGPHTSSARTVRSQMPCRGEVRLAPWGSAGHHEDLPAESDIC